MRAEHESDDAFEAWVDGEEHLRAHAVHAAFRAGSNAGRDAERISVRTAIARFAGQAQRLRAALEAQRESDWHQERSCCSGGRACDTGARLALVALNLRTDALSSALDRPAPAATPGVLRSAACAQHGARLCATCAGFEGGSPWAKSNPGEPTAEGGVSDDGKRTPGHPR